MDTPGGDAGPAITFDPARLVRLAVEVNMNFKQLPETIDCPECGHPGATPINLTTEEDTYAGFKRAVIRCERCGYSHAFIYALVPAELTADAFAGPVTGWWPEKARRRHSGNEHRLRNDAE